MTTTNESAKLFLDNLTCPNGCEAAIAAREEEDEVFYKDRDPATMWEWVDYSVRVRVPVFWCERCDTGWTDYRAEDIRAAAINAQILAKQIDYNLVQSLKDERSD